MSRHARFLLAVSVVITLVAIAAVGVAAKVKIRTQHDKTFDFRGVRTYAWHPDGAGEVKVLEANADDPASLRAKLEPVIKAAVEEQLAQRGLVPAAGGQPDLHVYYYLLIGAGTSSQYMGQFLTSTPEWGLPVMSGPTTSFKAYEQGSLVLDLSAPSLKSTVWRGVAQAEIDRQRSDADRAQRIRDGVKEMLGKFPPKK
jgi:hypothetical protein